jgi:hypothetical protein
MFESSGGKSDGTGLHEEHERGARQPAQERQLGRTRHRQRTGQHEIDEQPGHKGSARLREPQEDLVDEIAHARVKERRLVAPGGHE